MTDRRPAPVHLAIALDSAGWHPGAWRAESTRPADLFTAGYWRDLTAAAEAGLADFVTIEDSFSLHQHRLTTSESGAEAVAGRLDAVLVAARVAPLTRSIGLIPTANVTHTEPFHISKAVATLDYVSSGRAGVRLQVSPWPDEARLFGRRDIPSVNLTDQENSDVQELSIELLSEAGEFAQALRLLWDSWEDDTEIRDVATGRFIDREKLHYIDFSGKHFSVRGPSITPRPPQGQPIIAALGHRRDAYELIGREADIGFITPADDSVSPAIVDAIRAAHQAAGRGDGDPVRIFVDLTVVLGDTVGHARDRKARLDELAGAELTSDAEIFVGTAKQLAERIAGATGVSGVDGVRLRPAALPADLHEITAGVVPELQRLGLFRDGYQSRTLRGHLGLSRPHNRFANHDDTATGRQVRV